MWVGYMQSLTSIKDLIDFLSQSTGFLSIPFFYLNFVC